MYYKSLISKRIQDTFAVWFNTVHLNVTGKLSNDWG